MLDCVKFCVGFIACLPIQFVLYSEELQAQLPSVLTNHFESGLTGEEKHQGEGCVLQPVCAPFGTLVCFQAVLGTQI